MTARKKLGEVLEQVFYRGDQFVIERDGKAMAAVVPLKILEDYERSRERFFSLIGEAQERNRGEDPGRLAAEVDRAVRAVRKRKSA
jgi:antitoxin (DNA-binding transcriptional repressor) of toxin-antitoxin stability system